MQLIKYFLILFFLFIPLFPQTEKEVHEEACERVMNLSFENKPILIFDFKELRNIVDDFTRGEWRRLDPVIGGITFLNTRAKEKQGIFKTFDGYKLVYGQNEDLKEIHFNGNATFLITKVDRNHQVVLRQIVVKNGKVETVMTRSMDKSKPKINEEKNELFESYFLKSNYLEILKIKKLDPELTDEELTKLYSNLKGNYGEYHSFSMEVTGHIEGLNESDYSKEEVDLMKKILAKTDDPKLQRKVALKEKNQKISDSLLINDNFELGGFVITLKTGKKAYIYTSHDRGFLSYYNTYGIFMSYLDKEKINIDDIEAVQLFHNHPNGVYFLSDSDIKYNKNFKEWFKRKYGKSIDVHIYSFSWVNGNIESQHFGVH